MFRLVGIALCIVFALDLFSCLLKTGIPARRSWANILDLLGYMVAIIWIINALWRVGNA